MLKSSIEFKEESGVMMMWCENDSAPFDDYMIGHFSKGDDGYYRFKPYGQEMTCKHLRTAAKKASELNEKISD